MSSTVATVTFHGVGRPGRELAAVEHGVWVHDVDEFQRMLDVLAERPEVLITVDDGNVSDVDVVLPMLRARGLRATFFLLPGFFGERGFVGEDEARGLVEAGMTVGSHGMCHVPWRNLPADDAPAEFVDSRERLSHVVDRPVDLAAAPFGAYDRRAVSRARAAGYRYLYTSDGGPGSDGFVRPRTSVHSTDTAADVRRWLTVSPTRRALLLGSAKRTVKRWR